MKSKFIAYGGILTGMAFLFHGATTFLGEIGAILSPLATYPIFIGTYLNKKLGLSIYFFTSTLLLMINPEEAMIFTFATGLIGLILGFTLRIDKRIAYLLTTLGLTIGLYLLLQFMKFTVIGTISIENIPLVISILFLFSAVYNFITTLISIKVSKQIDSSPFKD